MNRVGIVAIRIIILISLVGRKTRSLAGAWVCLVSVFTRPNNSCTISSQSTGPWNESRLWLMQRYVINKLETYIFTSIDKHKFIASLEIVVTNVWNKRCHILGSCLDSKIDVPKDSVKFGISMYLYCFYWYAMILISYNMSLFTCNLFWFTSLY